MSAVEDDKVVPYPRRKRAIPSEDDYGAAPEDESPIAALFADDTLALQFSALYEHDLRFVAGWGRWMRWNGHKWAQDTTLHVYDQVRLLCRTAAADATSATTKKAVASGKTIASVEKLARTDRRHALTVTDWDTDQWLLNTPRGIVDLRNGAFSPHDRKRHMTKCTAVPPHGECPLWRQFLKDVTNNNVELQAYIQRVLGYALTGSIREHALFFAYGTGANGKGTLLNTVTAILGDYAIVANAETFTATNSSRHLTELARLQGARFVVAQETEEGKHLAEARIKAITGGDPITANFMRQDHFTFNPQFKLFIAGNHKPALANVDQAIRRRFNMIPFDVQIEVEKRDPDLADKLKAEWPGILQWMIDGCLDWQEHRLMPPAAVLDATEQYFEAEDTFAAWMDEICVVDRNASASAAELYRSWQGWAKSSGEEAGSKKSFNATMEGRGHKSGKQGGSRIYNGVGMKVKRPYHETEDDRS